jgi:hypothetical protein
MACISLCLLHGSEEEYCAIEVSDESGRAVSCETISPQASELIYTEVDSCCEPDCCPMKPLPVCALQKSSSFDFQANSDYQISPVLYPVPANFISRYDSQGAILHSASDPPFKRLCMLRI